MNHHASQNSREERRGEEDMGKISSLCNSLRDLNRISPRAEINNTTYLSSQKQKKILEEVGRVLGYGENEKQHREKRKRED